MANKYRRRNSKIYRPFKSADTIYQVSAEIFNERKLEEEKKMKQRSGFVLTMCK